jgi:DNA repair protein RecO (recombination protein O)
MIVKGKAIVLRTLKYGETSLIVHLYTHSIGRQLYLLKGVRKPSKTGSSKSNVFVPGMPLEIVATYQAQKQFQILKEYTPNFTNLNLLLDVKRNSIILFVLEVLDKCATEPENNEDLFEYIEQILNTIYNCTETTLSIIPIYYIVHLCKNLGFQIQQLDNIFELQLNLKEGVFENEININTTYASKEASSILSKINNCTIDEIQNLKINNNAKKEALRYALLYLQIHLPQVSNLKTPDVIQRVFRGV